MKIADMVENKDFMDAIEDSVKAFVRKTRGLAEKTAQTRIKMDALAARFKEEK